MCRRSFRPPAIPTITREPYKPNNYDGKFHGPVTVRTALANSFNVPAVKTLQFVGVYGDGGMVEMAKRLGFTSLTRDDYGLSLTLGGGDVSLLEMTGAFAVFANNGVQRAAGFDPEDHGLPGQCGVSNTRRRRASRSSAPSMPI